MQRAIYEKFLSEFVDQAKKMKIGDPLDDATTVGATISQDHAEKVLGYIEGAVKEGATVACGGKRVLLEGNFGCRKDLNTRPLNILCPRITYYSVYCIQMPIFSGDNLNNSHICPLYIQIPSEYQTSAHVHNVCNGR